MVWDVNFFFPILGFIIGWTLGIISRKGNFKEVKIAIYSLMIIVSLMLIILTIKMIMIVFL